MCSGGRGGECGVGLRNWRAAPGRAIENKDSGGMLRRKETERGFEEGRREIRLACGSLAGNNAHEQG